MKTRNRMFLWVLSTYVSFAGFICLSSGTATGDDVVLPKWRHLSSKRGELPVPNGGTQQTACIVFDVNGDGATDIVIGERTQAPAVAWLGYVGKTWKKFVIDDSHQRPEAGGWPHDVDGDGDLDLILGGDAGSDELWWYENPAPRFQPDRPWRRWLIKRGGGRAHHDQIVQDFTGDGRSELVFWNQGARKLFMADIPAKPRTTSPWSLKEMLDTSQVKTAIKQEGMASCDIDGDGRTDLLAGIYWFHYESNGRFRPVQIADHPGRIAAGRFRPGKIAQIVLGPGDGNGPLLLVSCRGNPLDSKAWSSKPLLDREVNHGHTLAVADINADGHLDIFCAEMHTPGHKEKCTAWILYGDGQGKFTTQILSVGIGNHDSRVADVNGDGRLDIVTKPYTWDTPRIDVWLNEGAKER